MSKAREILDLVEEKLDTIQLAKAYHVKMEQVDYDELGKKVSRDEFKKYFRIPRDADEDPKYKRDPKFDLKLLNKLK